MIALLAMPEDPTALPGWLDGTLLGPDLPQLVEELRVVHRPGAKPNLDAVLGGSRDEFLARGFSALPRAVRSQLLRNPDLLLELPELVYRDGGHFWFAEPLPPDEQARSEQVAANVYAALRSAEPRRTSGGRWAERVGWVAALAAAVVVAVTVFGSGTASAGWGFNKIAELPRTGGAKAVYAKLADLADEWNKKPTDDRLSLAKRLTEFRLGCSALQAATDLPLPAAEVAWLKTRCREWSDRIDGHLRDLDATGDVAAVRAAATATAVSIARELRERV